MLCALIEPYCRAGLKEPLPLGVKRMLRIILLKQWFSLSDTAVEEALYDSEAMREFVGIDVSRDAIPDQNTIWRFRLVLDHGELERRLFAAASQHLKHAGCKISMGTLVQASLFSEPHWMERKNLPHDPRCLTPALEPSVVLKSRATPAAVNLYAPSESL